jgi:hypothetical protein
VTAGATHGTEGTRPPGRAGSPRHHWEALPGLRVAA